MSRRPTSMLRPARRQKNTFEIERAARYFCADSM